MREIVIGAAVGLAGFVATIGGLEMHRTLATAAAAAPAARAVHKVRTSTLPMHDGVWGVEKRIATGEE